MDFLLPALLSFRLRLKVRFLCSQCLRQLVFPKFLLKVQFGLPASGVAHWLPGTQSCHSLKKGANSFALRLKWRENVRVLAVAFQPCQSRLKISASKHDPRCSVIPCLTPAPPDRLRRGMRRPFGRKGDFTPSCFA